MASLSVDETGEVLDVVWENQRKRPGGDYRAGNLSADGNDPAPFSNASGGPCASHQDLLLGPDDGSVPWDPAAGGGWEWLSDWVFDTKAGATDEHGWSYAPRFAPA